MSPWLLHSQEPTLPTLCGTRTANNPLPFYGGFEPASCTVCIPKATAANLKVLGTDPSPSRIFESCFFFPARARAFPLARRFRGWAKRLRFQASVGNARRTMSTHWFRTERRHVEDRTQAERVVHLPCHESRRRKANHLRGRRRPRLLHASAGRPTRGDERNAARVVPPRKPPPLSRQHAPRFP